LTHFFLALLGEAGFLAVVLLLGEEDGAAIAEDTPASFSLAA
jgi:hypothetical protein